MKNLALTTFTCLLLIIQNCIAQDTTNVGSSTSPNKKATNELEQDTIVFKKNRFQLNYYSDYNNYRSVYTNHGVLAGNQQKSDPDFIGLSSYSLGFGWIRQIKNHLSFNLDVEISSKKIQTKTIYFPLNGTNTVQEIQATYTNDVIYFNIPIGGSYSYAIGKKVNIGVYGGVALKFKILDGVFYSRSYSNNTGKGDQISFTNKKDGFNMDFRTAIFAEYKLKDVKFRLAPIYRIDLLNTFRGINSKKASSIGIGLVLII